MGSGESSPRRVTVENEDEDAIGIVKVNKEELILAVFSWLWPYSINQVRRGLKS